MTQPILADIILSEHSARMKEWIMEYASADKAHFDEYIQCLMSENEELSRRAAWPLGDVARRRQPWFEPYHEQLVNLIEKPHHQAVHRNVLRAYQTLPIPEGLEARIYDACLNKLQQHVQFPIAIRVFAMTVASRVVKHHPLLKDELMMVMESVLEDKSPGIQSRGKKIKKQLEKL